MSILDKVKSFGSSVAGGVTNTMNSVANLKNFFIEQYQDLKLHIEKVRTNLDNLKDTNIDLAWYHIKQGNISDALVRFKIIDTLIAPNDKEVFYGIGWCYFLKKDKEKAISYLEKAGDEDKVGLKAFLENSAEVTQSPTKILDEYRRITSESYIKKWINYPKYLPRLLTKDLLSVVEELPKDCKILDLGCSCGFIGAEIDRTMQKNYTLTGVDNIEELTSYTKSIRDDKIRVYDKIVSMSAKQFLNSPEEEKYNIIFSFNSLDFAKNLDLYFSRITRILEKNGYLALLLQTDTQTIWNPFECRFIYSADEITAKLKLAELEILDIKEWRFPKTATYKMFIAKK
ncbi:MAG: methyltransferase domain-containing protein [Rickettsiaceae bacterium]|nr:methyltransferase domain-containing protein [Rickettsiaceae bacterium]